MRYRFCAFLVIAILSAGTSHGASKAKSKAKPKPPTKTVTAVKLKPAPPAKTFKPTCQKDFTDALLKFHRRTIVEAYAQHGTHDPKWDDKVRSFLEAYALVVAKAEGAPQPTTVVAQAKDLLSVGCTDPLVISLCGAALCIEGSLADAQPLLEKALAELPKSGYCKWRAAVLPSYLLRVRTDLHTLTAEAERALLDQQNSLMAQSFRDGSYKPGEERILLWNLFSVVETWLRRTVGDELAKDPVADRYVVNVFRGQTEIDDGWADRGKGWASEVTEEGWKGFEAHLTTARKLLTEAWKLHPEYPEAPTLMIKVTMAGLGNPGDTERMWFDRATAAQFDYIPAYAALRWALRPRWGGSLEEIYQHGVRCLQTKRFDTEVPWEFLQSLCNITDDLQGKKTYWLRPETEKYLETLYDGYTKANPRQADRYKTFRAATAWYVADYKKAKTLLDELGDRADDRVFAECFKTTPEAVRTETAVLGGDQASRLQSAAVLYRSGRLAESLAAYEAIRNDAKGDDSILRYVREKTAPIAIENALSKGDWVDLRASADLVEWQSKRMEEWSVEPDGTIVLTPKSDGCPELRSRADFGTRFEIRGQVEFGSEYRFAVIAFRHPSRLIHAVLDRANDEVRVSQGLCEELTQSRRAGITDTTDFLVRYADGAISVYIGGKPVLKDFAGDKSAGEAMEVGIGAYVFTGELPAKFRDLQVRKLTAEP